MDFRNIHEFLEEKYKEKEPFDLYCAKMSKMGEVFCKKFKMYIEDTSGYNFLEFVNKSEGKKFGFNFFIIMDKGKIRKDLDKQPKAIGRTKEEALQCLKNSLQYKLELREKDLEGAKRKVKSISQEIDMLNNVLKAK